MTTVSPPRHVMRSVQTWGPEEKAVLGEVLPLARPELCEQRPHDIGHAGLGSTAPSEATGGAR